MPERIGRIAAPNSVGHDADIGKYTRRIARVDTVTLAVSRVGAPRAIPLETSVG